MDQAASRAHRMGQLGEVLVTYLVLEGSLDARQIEVFCEKGRVIGKAMDHEEVVLVGTEEKHENLEGKNNDNASW
jgi:SNF2 family DNA or RNA helicase